MNDDLTSGNVIQLKPDSQTATTKAQNFDLNAATDGVISTGDIIMNLQGMVDEKDAEIEYLRGVVTVQRDFFGKVVIKICKFDWACDKPDVEILQRNIEKEFIGLSAEECESLKCDAIFHISATKVNNLTLGMTPSWRDQYPLRDINQIDLFNVINQYY